MVMAQLLLKMGYTIGIAHCNFQLRGDDSDGDEQLVKHWATERAVPFYSTVFDTKKYAADQQVSTQMAARDLRYAFFEDIRIAKAYDYILTAHHLDDRLETFWLNFSRGTGWKGLTSLKGSHEHLRRPLLCVNREQIANYQQAFAVPFREDASNASDVYRRNAFRHTVLPALYEWEPQLADRMAANFTRLEQMYSIYAQAVENQLADLTQATSNGLVFQRKALQAHLASATIVWELLHPYGFSAEACRQALTAKAGTILIAEDWRLLVQEEQLLLESINEETTQENSYYWDESVDQLILDSNHSLVKSSVTKPEHLAGHPQLVHLSGQVLVYPLEVRHWQPGDSFCPLGMKGKHQKLQDFFTNNKIDRFAREQQWLLVNGDGKIIWIIGQRLDERFKVTTDDVEVLKVEVVTAESIS